MEELIIKASKGGRSKRTLGNIYIRERHYIKTQLINIIWCVALNSTYKSKTYDISY